MSFQEKGAIVMTSVLVIVYGIYFTAVWRLLSTTSADEVVYQPLMIIATVPPLIILAVLSHIVLALANPKEANANDERDRLITLRAERIGGYVLAMGVFAGIVLAMIESPYFYIANALLLAWVLAEITERITKVVLYRRGS